MAKQIGLKIDNLKEITQKMNQQPEIAAKSIQAALKRTETKANTMVSKSVREEYNIKAARIKRAKKAPRQRNRGPSGMTYDIVYRDTLMSLHHFKPTQTKAGVKVTVIKGQRKTAESAFLQTANKGRTVFKRASAERYPLKALKTLSVPQAISSERIEDAMMEDIGDFFQQRLLHEWNHRNK